MECNMMKHTLSGDQFFFSFFWSTKKTFCCLILVRSIAVIDWLIDWLVDYSHSSWLIDWLVDSSQSSWLTDWLIDYTHPTHEINRLIDWSNGHSMFVLVFITGPTGQQTRTGHDRRLAVTEDIIWLWNFIKPYLCWGCTESWCISFLVKATWAFRSGYVLFVCSNNHLPPKWSSDRRDTQWRSDRARKYDASPAPVNAVANMAKKVAVVAAVPVPVGPVVILRQDVVPLLTT